MFYNVGDVLQNQATQTASFQFSLSNQQSQDFYQDGGVR